MMKFQIGDTVTDIKLGIKGFVTETDSYIDIFGDGKQKEDYWVAEDYVNNPERLVRTRVVIVEKIKSHD